MLIYGKNPLNIFFSRTMTMKLCTQQKGLEPHKSFINDDPRLTLTYYTARSALFIYAFTLEKSLHIFKHLLLRNHLTDWSHILYGIAMPSRNLVYKCIWHSTTYCFQRLGPLAFFTMAVPWKRPSGWNVGSDVMWYELYYYSYILLLVGRDIDQWPNISWYLDTFYISRSLWNHDFFRQFQLCYFYGLSFTTNWAKSVNDKLVVFIIIFPRK